MLLKAGLALIVIVFIGILMQRMLSAWADAGANGPSRRRVAPHAAWAALAWMLSVIAALGIITGALFLMPAVTAFVGSFLSIKSPKLSNGNTIQRRRRALPFSVHQKAPVATPRSLSICALPFVLPG